VEADQFALVKLHGRRSVGIERECFFPANVDLTQPKESLAPLHATLAAGEWKAPRVDVVLSDQLVLYFNFEVLPGTRNFRELRQLIQARFEEIFGLPADEWEILADLAPFTSPLLICALNRALLNELRRIFAETGHAPPSIQPFFVREFNHWQRRIPAGRIWFGAVERQSLTLALLSPGAWHGLRTHSISHNDHDALTLFVRRDQVAHGISASAIPVWLAGNPSLSGTPESDASTTVMRLGQSMWPGRTEPWSRDYRIALAGVWP
jgi:hypothetical protein